MGLLQLNQMAEHERESRGPDLTRALSGAWGQYFLSAAFHELAFLLLKNFLTSLTGDDEIPATHTSHGLA